jgi:hypothetical protein
MAAASGTGPSPQYQAPPGGVKPAYSFDYGNVLTIRSYSRFDVKGGDLMCGAQTCKICSDEYAAKVSCHWLQAGIIASLADAFCSIDGY